MPVQRIRAFYHAKGVYERKQAKEGCFLVYFKSLLNSIMGYGVKMHKKEF